MIRYFADHPTAANLLMIAFLVIGTFSVPALQRETFPRIKPDKVEIQVLYPGARAEDVKEAICRRVEDALDAVNHVREIACESREGLATATVEMDEGADFDRFASEIKTEIDAITDFPEKAEKPITRQIGLTDFVAAIAVVGPESPPALKAYAEDVKSRMLQWGGITKVVVTGFSDHQIRIELSDHLLRRFGLSASDIADKIQRQSVDLPVGGLHTTEREILVRFADERKTPFEFLDLVVVAGTAGGQIRLGDIATVTDRFELDEAEVFYNGRRAAVLEIYKNSQEDTLRAIDAAKSFLENERTIAPPGIVLAVTRDASSIVRDRLGLLTSNGAQGLVLVLAAMWLFFGLRYSFWVALGLPVSFAGAFGVMVALGYSINMLTMVGLLIAIGLLMDDAIVISENIATHRQRGKSPLAASVDGAREVFPSVFASFVTTACIFGSLMFLEGDIGQVLRVIPVVMLTVLTVSLVEAFVILPNHLRHSIASGPANTGRVQAAVERWMDWLRDSVAGPLVAGCLRWRYLTIGAAVGLLLMVLALPVSGLLKFVAFPELDGDTIEARILLPQGTPLSRTREVVEQVDKALQRVDAALTAQQPEKSKLVRGVTLTYNRNADAFEAGTHVATITVDLLGAERRTVTAETILAIWRRETGDVADALSINFTETALGPAGLPIDLRLKSENLSQLKEASVELQAWLSRYRGVHDVIDDFRPGKPEIRIRLRDGASSYGIDARTVADQLRTAFFGNTVSEIQVGPESLEIDVRLQPGEQSSLASLETFAVTTSQGQRIPVTAIATLEAGRGFARINRINGLPTITIRGDVDTRIANAAAIMDDTLSRFIPDLLLRHPDVRFGLEGQNKEAGHTQQSMMRGFVFGLIGVFLLLSFQFRSYVEPLVVMIAIPMALIGVILGHVIMGLDLSMPSMLGFVALAGVVVNNSILLVNFTKERHAAGAPLEEAAIEASRRRLRAIFLTSVTTMVGLLPMLSETSLQAQVLIPLVTSLIFGLLSATLLVLIVVPALYLVLDDFGWIDPARDKTG